MTNSCVSEKNRLSLSAFDEGSLARLNREILYGNQDRYGDSIDE